MTTVESKTLKYWDGDEWRNSRTESRRQASSRAPPCGSWSSGPRRGSPAQCSRRWRALSSSDPPPSGLLNKNELGNGSVIYTQSGYHARRVDPDGSPPLPRRAPAGNSCGDRVGSGRHQPSCISSSGASRATHARSSPSMSARTLPSMASCPR